MWVLPAVTFIIPVMNSIVSHSTAMNVEWLLITFFEMFLNSVTLNLFSYKISGLSVEVDRDWAHVRYSQVLSFTLLACCLPAKETHYPSYKMLGRSHRTSACTGEEKIPVPIRKSRAWSLTCRA
jgi:hypothetical protein